MPYFQYTQSAAKHLIKKDAALGRVIEEVGPIRREVMPNLFEALVNSIVGQQISSAALKTVYARLCDGCGGAVTPQAIFDLGVEALQKTGITYRKAQYLTNAAQEVLSGRLDLAALAALPDDEFCTALCRLPGVGQWTAEMLLIFSLQRQNVLSFGDLGIHRGMRMVYRHRVITPALFQKYQRRYAPYATLAGLYFWAVAGGALPGLVDPAAKQKPSAAKK